MKPVKANWHNWPIVILEMTSQNIGNKYETRIFGFLYDNFIELKAEWD